MKINLLIVFGMILTLNSIYGQGQVEVQLPSIKVPPDEAKNISRKVKSDLFELRKDGVLNATKGNHIVYHKKSKKVLIKPVKLKSDLVLAPTERDDVLILIDWVLVCTGGCGTCAFGSIEGDGYYCGGCEECFHFVLIDPTKFRQYETQGGNYSSNWNDL